MENVARFEEKYEMFKKNKKHAAKICACSLLIWGILLLPAARLGAFLYEWGDSASGMLEMIIVGIPLLIIVGVMLYWPIESWQAYRSHVKQMTYEMSLDMMENSFRERFGNYTKEQVQYKILQHRCGFDAKVEHNNRCAWLEGDAPFMIHWTKIHNDRQGEDYELYFDGTAISVAAEHPVWKFSDRRTLEKKMEKAWTRAFRDQVADGPVFGLDEIEGKLWLTVGFQGLRLGEKDMDVWDLQRWYQQCQNDVEFLNRALELIRSITPTSCDVLQKAGRQ